MRHKLLDVLRCPQTGEPLELITLRTDEEGVGRIRDGLLVADGERVYPVVDGVPIMVENQGIPSDFARRYEDELRRFESQPETLPDTESAKSEGTESWSFSDEWDAHFSSGVRRTWGWTLSERVEQFLMEVRVDRDWCRDKWILDAGAGNGSLTEGVGSLGANVVGLDLSTGVRYAEKHRSEPTADFVQGDIMIPPMAPETFDAVVSIGVLHHTANTRAAFESVARLVKPEGRLYVWLYRKPESIFGRLLKLPIFQALRWTVSRLPRVPQRSIVETYARLVRSLHQIRSKSESIPLSEYVVAAYDDLTPRWRHYHSAYEVARWFHEEGFGPPTLSHWDNPYGFGLVATKNPQCETPGIHYGGAKLWDDQQTLIG